MAAYNSLFELYVARLREFYRQPARIFWVYGFPMLLAIGLGVAFKSRPPETLQVTVVENEHSASLLSAVESTQGGASGEGRPSLAMERRSESDALQRLRTGKTPLVVIPNEGGVIYRYDPTRPEATTARLVVDDTIQRAFGRHDPLPSTDLLNQELGSRYIDFLIPGLLGLNTMGGGLWGIGFLLVNFRIAKLLKRFMATPMPRHNFLLALLGARLTFLVPDVVVLLLLGVFAFEMPIRGSLALVLLVVVVGALAFSGIGLLVASRATTTEAVSGLMNLVMLPMWLLSGVFFSYERFPEAIHPFIEALPLTQLLNALRAVILEGAGLADISGALVILSLWAVVTFLIALRIFRWS